MKIHKTPAFLVETRETWIYKVIVYVSEKGGPELQEMSTGYRDGGATVRFALHMLDGIHQVDFEWRKESAIKAAEEICAYQKDLIERLRVEDLVTRSD